MKVSWNRGTPKLSSWIGFSILNQLFWGTPLMETTISPDILPEKIGQKLIRIVGVSKNVCTWNGHWGVICLTAPKNTAVPLGLCSGGGTIRVSLHQPIMGKSPVVNNQMNMIIMPSTWNIINVYSDFTPWLYRMLHQYPVCHPFENENHSTNIQFIMFQCGRFINNSLAHYMMTSMNYLILHLDPVNQS